MSVKVDKWGIVGLVTTRQNSTNTAAGLFKAACRRVMLRIPRNDAAWRVIRAAVWPLSEQ